MHSSLSCRPLPSQLRPGRPFSIAAARNFARFCRRNLQRSCALRFDSARAFLSLSGAVDYISSLHLTFQSAHFLMTCACFVSNLGIYRSRAPPSTIGSWELLSGLGRTARRPINTTGLYPVVGAGTSLETDGKCGGTGGIVIADSATASEAKMAGKLLKLECDM